MEAGLKRGHSKIFQDSSSDSEGSCSDEDEDVEEEPHTTMKGTFVKEGTFVI
jgi:hypothetical protein